MKLFIGDIPGQYDEDAVVRMLQNYIFQWKKVVMLPDQRSDLRCCIVETNEEDGKWLLEVRDGKWLLEVRVNGRCVGPTPNPRGQRWRFDR